MKAYLLARSTNEDTPQHVAVLELDPKALRRLQSLATKHGLLSVEIWADVTGWTLTGSLADVPADGWVDPELPDLIEEDELGEEPWAIESPTLSIQGNGGLRFEAQHKHADSVFLAYLSLDDLGA
jgi:hypothetical protein